MSASLTDKLQSFWDLVGEVWQEGVYGLNIGEIIEAFAVFIFFYLIRGVFCRFILARVSKLAAKTETQFDDILIESISPPLKMVPIALGFFLGTSLLTAPAEIELLFTNFSKSLIAFTIFWALYRAAQPVGKTIEQNATFLTPEMASWLSKFLQFSFALIGGAAILEIWGIAVGPLVAGLGLFGVAVALGAQDLFKNLIAGLFIIGEKRFHRGDWILVDGIVEGTVEEIGFRTTKVRRFDKAPVYVPNAHLSDNAVTNFSRTTFRRIRWTLGLRYDSSADQLREVRSNIEKYLTEDERFVRPHEAATFIRIDSFGASSIDLSLYCFTRTIDWLTWLAIKEELLLKVKGIVEAAGTDFAFPSRSLYFENLASTEPLISDRSKD